MSDQTGEFSISPRLGTRKFRRNARLTVADGTLTATDRDGNSSSAPLDDSPSALEMATLRLKPGTNVTELAFVDREGRALAIADLGDWDSFENIELRDAAGLKTFHRQPDDLPPLRADTRHVVDSTWWKYTPTVGPLGFAAGMFGSAIGPLRWAGVPILAAAFCYSMAALFTGAFAKHRKGPAWEAEQAFAAGDKHAVEAYHEARRKRLEESGRGYLLEREPETGPA